MMANRQPMKREYIARQHVRSGPMKMDEEQSFQIAHRHELSALEDHVGMRLDQFVTKSVPDLSRSYAQTLIDDGMVTVDGMDRRSSFKISAGESISVEIPETESMELQPEAIPLDVLYEDDGIIVLNKPAGMVVHPAPGHPGGTLVNALLHHAPEISVAGSTRPGIVHRLDKDTSGVMVVAKTDHASQSLVEQWSQGKVRKRYVAIVAGVVAEEEAIVDVPIARHRTDRKRMGVDRDGKAAVTQLSVTERFADTTLLDIDLRTGRTHQIRVHMAYIRHSIIGDNVYGGATSARLAKELNARRQMLHAAILGFVVPGSGEPMEFQAPLPADIERVLARLRSEGT